MNPIKIKNCIIGEGKPKIIVPIIATTKDDIIKEAKNILNKPIDIVEWRIDWYQDSYNSKKIIEIANELSNILHNIPLLCTFRTKKEGGEKDIDINSYTKLLREISIADSIDIIDVEIFTDDNAVKDIISTCHKNNTFVIASNHDFDKTPSKDDIIARLSKMDKMGADILKIAVMPNNKNDLLTLLNATVEMNSKYTNKPLVTMSMGKLGMISRLIGESIGSTMTFGTLTISSAPGQINIDDLNKVLDIIHKNS